jgi:hypothetical protein
VTLNQGVNVRKHGDLRDGRGFKIPTFLLFLLFLLPSAVFGGPCILTDQYPDPGTPPKKGDKKAERSKEHMEKEKVVKACRPIKRVDVLGDVRVDMTNFKSHSDLFILLAFR